MNLPINQIIQGDCLDIMRQWPDDCIDLTVTSPPYDNLRDYKGYSFDFENIAKELYRITKQGGVIVWIVGDATINGSETGTSFRQALYFKEIGFNLHDTMIYQKSGSTYTHKTRYYPCFEYMFVLSKNSPKTVNLIKDRKNNWSGPWGTRSYRQPDGSLIKKEGISYKEYGIRYNIWKYNVGFGFSTKDKIAYKHPAIFPDKLAADHIASWSNEQDLILDPMCGSGTTCKTAKMLNRNYIGIDISEEYCKIARERCNLLW